jgi:cytochrome P450
MTTFDATDVGHGTTEEKDVSSALEYDPFDFAIRDNPYPVYRRLRDEAPVFYSAKHDFYALSRYADVMAAYMDHETYSSAYGVTLEDHGIGQPWLGSMDQPEHRWHRQLLSRKFTISALASLEPFTRRSCEALLDPHRGERRFDVIEDFTVRLPLMVISKLLSIPDELQDNIYRLSHRLIARDAHGEISPDAQQAQSDLFVLLRDLVVERRKNPGHDMISELITSRLIDDAGQERDLSDDEVAYRFLELAFAGHETTAKAIPNVLIALAWYPDQRRELIADRSLLPGAVEEVLRWDPPKHYAKRVTTRDVELHGTTIPDGSRALLVIGSATHDERQYDDPDFFDIHRQIERPVAFGFGIHHCLGRALARLEMRVALDEFLKRFPNYALADSGVVRAASANLRGLSCLPIELGRAA